MTRDALAKAAQSLSPDERADLIDQILQSLTDDEDAGMRELWMNEARQRRDEVRQGRVEAIPGEQASAEIDRLLRP